VVLIKRFHNRSLFLCFLKERGLTKAEMYVFTEIVKKEGFTKVLKVLGSHKTRKI
jgi:hypothetical protein